jgi:hypothetical protein
MRDGRWLRPLGVSADFLFWIKVDGDDYTGCWTWRGGMNRGGYGLFQPAGETSTVAHRYAYESMVGPIPDGLHLDHLCSNRLCVNPWHLEPVTQAVNTRRATDKLRRTHCSAGHPLSGENIQRDAPSGSPRCRTCRNAQSVARKRAARAAVSA